MACKRGRLSEERYKLLESVGFEWNLLGSNWIEEFQSLKVFFAIQGRWPKQEGGALATWCYTQQERRKKGRSGKERTRVLDEVRFVWSRDLDGE